jgi:hypothetical protein
VLIINNPWRGCEVRETLFKVHSNAAEPVLEPGSAFINLG